MASKRAAKRQKQTKKQQSGIRRYFSETRGELRKVSWPTRREAISLTKVVIIVMVVMMIFLGGVDAIFLRFFALLFG